jgi:hypothetical protein
MKVSELLRSLADMISRVEGDPPGTAKVEVDHNPHTQEPISAQDGETDTFVPPLQAKIEILKKSVGMDNVYDGDKEDELGRVKGLAGIHPAQREAAASDEPLDD